MDGRGDLHDGTSDAAFQAAVNQRVYASPRLVRGYVDRALRPVERTILDVLRPSVSGGRVLERGCGAGAITRELIEVGADVVGVDVSPAMVAYCRSEFPSGTFVVGDLRDLSPHEDAAYGCVVAGDNLLDVLGHDERPAVFGQLKRVLGDGGLLYFSSHNRNSAEALEQARTGPRLRFERSPPAQLRGIAGYVQGSLNHRRLARHQRIEEGWAILNDPAHRWSLLHHYVTRELQARELGSWGFELLGVWGMDGRPLEPADDDSGLSELHYVARVAI
ncbi:MAG: class I SAM-dependent methyltransferase [Gaiellaceae bacterium]